MGHREPAPLGDRPSSSSSCAEARYDQLGTSVEGGCSVSRVALRLYTVSEERDMMPVAMTHEDSLERGSLVELYVRHAPEGIRLAFLLTGDRDHV